MKMLWPFMLVVVGVSLGSELACIAPFVAVAALAARTLSLRVALAVVAAMWFGNQAIGFGFLHYPHDAMTFAWGGVLLVTATLAMLAARRIANVALAFAAAFVTYEVVQFAFALPTGSGAAYAPAIDAQVLGANVLGLAILGAVRLVLLALERGAFVPGYRRDAQR